MVKAKSERKRENKLVDFFFFSVVVILFYFIWFWFGLFLFNQTAQTTKRDSQIAHICTPKNKCVNFFFFFSVPCLGVCVCVKSGKCAVSHYTKKIFACVAKFNYHGCKNIYFNNQSNGCKDILSLAMLI